MRSYLNEQLSMLAKGQYEEYKVSLADSIEESVKGSKVYRGCSNVPNFKLAKQKDSLDNYHIEFDNLTSNDSIFAHANGKTAVMNFASYTRPGGGFLKGAHAQEESLCLGSTLYNVLEKFSDEYNYNFRTKKNNLYTNFAIYSPNIKFIKEGFCEDVDVITVPAPNIGAYINDGYYISESQQYDVVKDRIEFALNICNVQHVKTLILGAFGCGVFKNDPNIVACAFRDVLLENDYNFESVIFSIPDELKLKKFKDTIQWIN